MSISKIFRLLYLFLIWVPLFGNNQEADASIRRLSAIQIEEDVQSEAVSGVITLDNGTRWLWTPCHCCCRKIDDWEIGDEIYILNVVKGKYQLFNPNHTSYQPEVLIEASSIACLPTVHAISGLGKLLVLSDGTQWHLGLWSALWGYRWKIGDPVIVIKDVPAYGYSTHRLLNMNKEKAEENDYSYVNATLLQGTE